MAILDILALHGIIKTEHIPELARRIDSGESLEGVLLSAGVKKRKHPTRAWFLLQPPCT